MRASSFSQCKLSSCDSDVVSKALESRIIKRPLSETLLGLCLSEIFHAQNFELELATGDAEAREQDHDFKSPWLLA
jgi:hypothetical protein